MMGAALVAMADSANAYLRKQKAAQDAERERDLSDALGDSTLAADT